jgi:hypothetical protein
MNKLRFALALPALLLAAPAIAGALKKGFVVKNRILDAEAAQIISFVNSSGGALVSGDGYWAGSTFGVLQGDVANTATGVMHTRLKVCLICIRSDISKKILLI